MPNSDWTESLVLAEWAEKECSHLDLIASWEVLVSVYESLGFLDTLSDEQRLNEFKTVIGETNKFLTRMRNGLSHARTIEDAIAFLDANLDTKDMNAVKTRSSVAYNKLKQRWIGMAIRSLEASQEMVAQRRAAEEGERDD